MPVLGKERVPPADPELGRHHGRGLGLVAQGGRAWRIWPRPAQVELIWEGREGVANGGVEAAAGLGGVGIGERRRKTASECGAPGLGLPSAG